MGADGAGDAGDALPRARSHRPRLQPVSLLAGPGELLRGPVSDYFAAWDGGLAGFLTSRVGHPFFTIEGGDLVGLGRLFRRRIRGPGRARAADRPDGGAAGDLLDSTAAPSRERTGSASTAGIPPAGAAGTTISASSAGRTSSRTSTRRPPTGRPSPSTSSRSTTATRPRSATGSRPSPATRTSAGWPGPSRRGGFRAGIWAAPFSAAETSRLFAEHPGLDGRGGRPAQALLQGLGPDDLRPGHDAPGRQELARRRRSERCGGRDSPISRSTSCSRRPWRARGASRSRRSRPIGRACASSGGRPAGISSWDAGRPSCPRSGSSTACASAKIPPLTGRPSPPDSRDRTPISR